MIDTREELIDALTEAAELEHGLLLQYLFAAYSMKKRADEGLSPADQELVRTWEGVITGVAREEMAHLGCVCNLLSAIGGAPRLGRPNFPQPLGSYYPFDFRLMAFGDEALHRFIGFELPEGETPPAPRALAADATAVTPDPLVFQYIGNLYGQIRHAFGAIEETELFIGPRAAQDTDDWSNRFRLHLVTDRASAFAAVDAIVLEGEGAPGHREGSHYDRFLDIRAALAARPGIEPSRPVVSDPRTRVHRDAPAGGTLIEPAETVAVAQLADSVYITVLLLLLQYYGYDGETEPQRDAIRSAIRHLMSAIFRPLAEVLTELPIAGDPARGTAGPTFELYSDVRVAPVPENRFTIVFERLDRIAARAGELHAAGGPARLRSIGESVGWIRRNLGAVA